MAKQQTYSLIATITANNESDAETVRADLVGPVEDAREGGGGFPRGADASIGELVELDLDAVLTGYRGFHDTMSNLVGEGCLISFKDAHPIEYAWMIDAMERISGLDPRRFAPVRPLLTEKERFDRLNALMQEAMAIGFAITDYVDAANLTQDYKLTYEQALEVLPQIDVGDYDAECVHANAGSSDGRRKVLDAAVSAAGFSEDEDEDEDDEDARTERLRRQFPDEYCDPDGEDAQ